MPDHPHEVELPIISELGEQLKAGFRRREAHDIGRALRRRRLLLLSPVIALVAAGCAAAAVAALRGQPSAPLSGPVAPSPSDSFPGSGTARYSVVVTPSLGAGSVGWCISEQLQIPVPVPVADVKGLRELLRTGQAQAREFRRATAETLAGRTATVHWRGRTLVFRPGPPVGTPPVVAARWKRGMLTAVARYDRELAEYPTLLRELTQPRVRNSLAFQQAVRDISGEGFQYTQPGTSCGHVQRAGSPFIGAPYIGYVGGGYNILDDAHSPAATRLTTTSVYLTASRVAAVRLGRNLTILTRAVEALPDGYRIAVRVTASQQNLKPGQKPLDDYRIYTAGQPIEPFYGTLPATSASPAPVALGANGRRIASARQTAAPRARSTSWLPDFNYQPNTAPTGPTTTAVAIRPSSSVTIKVPAGACEIDTSAAALAELGGINAAEPAQLGGGAVLAHVRGFPTLEGNPLLSCAYVQWYDARGSEQVAILLNARDPGATPPPLPNASPIKGHPGFVNEPIDQLVRSTNITARRVDNAWLVVETLAPLRERIALLKRLTVCVHLRGAPCPATSQIESLPPTP
ncbi:MAG: hypothetical protein ABSG64_03580 [Solirubrobacteraceae bacterium]|jgi:hypothetical protein